MTHTRSSVHEKQAKHSSNHTAGQDAAELDRRAALTMKMIKDDLQEMAPQVSQGDGSKPCRMCKIEVLTAPNVIRTHISCTHTTHTLPHTNTHKLNMRGRPAKKLVLYGDWGSAVSRAEVATKNLEPKTG